MLFVYHINFLFVPSFLSMSHNLCFHFCLSVCTSICLSLFYGHVDICVHYRNLKVNKLIYFILEGPRSDNIPGQPVQGPERAPGPLHLAPALLPVAQPDGNRHKVGAVSRQPYHFIHELGWLSTKINTALAKIRIRKLAAP